MTPISLLLLFLLQNSVQMSSVQPHGEGTEPPMVDIASPARKAPVNIPTSTTEAPNLCYCGKNNIGIFEEISKIKVKLDQMVALQGLCTSVALFPLLGLLYSLYSSDKKLTSKNQCTRDLEAPPLDDTVRSPSVPISSETEIEERCEINSTEPDRVDSVIREDSETHSRTRQGTQSSTRVRNNNSKPSSYYAHRSRSFSPHVWLPGFTPPVQQWVAHNSPFGRQKCTYLH